MKELIEFSYIMRDDETGKEMVVRKTLRGNEKK